MRLENQNEQIEQEVLLPSLHPDQQMTLGPKDEHFSIMMPGQVPVKA